MNLESVDDLPSQIYLGIAAVCGTLSAGLTTPLGVINKTIQTGQYKTMMEAFKSIYSNSGVKGLFKGFKSRCIWIASSLALTMFACKYIYPY